MKKTRIDIDVLAATLDACRNIATRTEREEWRAYADFIAHELSNYVPKEKRAQFVSACGVAEEKNVYAKYTEKPKDHIVFTKN